MADREHVHKWEMADAVIDTYPPMYTWFCECGVETHDPQTGDPCQIKHFR